MRLILKKKDVPDFNDELPYLIALTMVNGVGNFLAKNLLSYCGSAKSVFKESKTLLQKIPGIGTLTANNIRNFNLFDEIEIELELISKHRIRTLTMFDADYPKRLKEIDDNPLVLFMKGNTTLNAERMIAMVGTRNATVYGRQFTEELIEALMPYGITVVSGLAAGTDSNVHKACLKNKIPTIGVLGHGFSTIYPGMNRSLAAEMMKDGALVSEFRYATPGNKENFPRRNRIVAAMCDATIVVESGNKGGSMITADLANQYNRDVFALPGKITDTCSIGCNKLIAANQAAIIDSISGLIRQLGYDLIKSKKRDFQLQLISELNQDELSVVNILSENQLPIDELQFKSQMNVSKLALLLLDLEFKGIIRSLPGKVYALEKDMN